MNKRTNSYTSNKSTGRVKPSSPPGGYRGNNKRYGDGGKIK